VKFIEYYVVLFLTNVKIAKSFLNYLLLISFELKFLFTKINKRCRRIDRCITRTEFANDFVSKLAFFTVARFAKFGTGTRTRFAIFHWITDGTKVISTFETYPTLASPSCAFTYAMTRAVIISFHFLFFFF